VHTVTTMIEPLLEAEIEITHARADRPATVLADRTQIELAILNLALNARDAQPDGGVIRLESHIVERPDASWVELTVTDAGSGIDEALCARIFDPFFSTKKDGEGTGLGLSIVYDLVTQNGGEIDVASTPGKGTTFRIVIPLAERTGLWAVPEDEDADAPGFETVLLVEHEDVARESLRDALEHYGYRVLAAETHAEALATVACEPVDVVVTDGAGLVGNGIPVVSIDHTETPLLIAEAIRTALRDAIADGRPSLSRKRLSGVVLAG
jgi:Histidine kinase-, DNA gyrase B-, and HSP90-like ATPase